MVWRFDRDLIRAALEELIDVPTALVGFEPHPMYERFLIMSLTVPDGYPASYYVSRDLLFGFYHATREVVPVGTEDVSAALDAALAAMGLTTGEA